MTNTLWLFNTTIITGLPPSTVGNGDDDSHRQMAAYTISAITPAEARQIVEDALSKGESMVSAIGHDATASAMSAILQSPVQVNRVQAEQAPGDRAICLKIRGRLPEGEILGSEALEAIGYDLYLLRRQA